MPETGAALYLGLIPGDYVGWGICSRYLIQELSALVTTALIDPNDLGPFPNRRISGKVFHTIGDHRLTKVIDVTGDENFGYTFFENCLPDTALENARAFDRIFAGSTWCRNRLVEAGITWSDVLIQGIDPNLFFPIVAHKPSANDYFVIFSGGKFELRKGQDIAIQAVKVMQERHPDILFVTCWYNAWPFSMNTMAESRYIRYRPQKKWDDGYIRNLLHASGIDMDRTEMLPRISQDQLRSVYACTDLGLFPNRCEGGTNLVLMEYMACAKPVVASYTSGHKDVLAETNSLLLKRMKPLERRNGGGAIEARWEEPDLEEVIAQLEYAYRHRDQIRSIGRQAGHDMKQRTWRRMALDLVGKLGLPRMRGSDG